MNKEIRKEVQKLGTGEENNVSGGYVIKVNSKDLEKQNIDLNPYLVIDNKTGKIVDSFKQYKDAAKADAEYNAENNEPYVWQISGSEIEKHIFKTLDGSNYVFK